MQDVSGANLPLLPNGNIDAYYVTWTESTTNPGTWEEVLSTTRPENWSNYNEGQWANMKTVAKTPYEEGKYNEAYWVWIPRYAYKVPEKPTSSDYTRNPTFEIAFLKDTSNEPVDSSKVDGPIISTEEAKIAGGVVAGQWVVHPAFDFGGVQLKGIWVAKYEASSSNEIGEGQTPLDVNQKSAELYVNVKPSTKDNLVWSWTDVNSTIMFAVCQNMKNQYGALDESTASDPHMMKNTEWGAVVYITQSIYGRMKNEESGPVWVNNYKPVPGSGNYYSVTGFAVASADAGITSNLNEVYEYNTEIGINASTTGNIYGIYDMAGGAWEYTAALTDNGNTSGVIYRKTIVDAAANENTAKYVDVYDAAAEEGQQACYERILKNGKITKYGDALYETSSSYNGAVTWQNDQIEFVYYSKPLIGRGSGVGKSAGLFSISCFIGGNYSANGFRPVCIGQ